MYRASQYYYNSEAYSENKMFLHPTASGHNTAKGRGKKRDSSLSSAPSNNRKFDSQETARGVRKSVSPAKEPTVLARSAVVGALHARLCVVHRRVPATASSRRPAPPPPPRSRRRAGRRTRRSRVVRSNPSSSHSLGLPCCSGARSQKQPGSS